jgi:hypothetical protein
MDHLEQKVGLVLNRYWQAIHVKNPMEAISSIEGMAFTFFPKFF